MEEVEVRVHSVRRRRTDTPVPPAARVPNLRNLLIYSGLTILSAALMFEGHLRHKAPQAALPVLAEAIDVLSDITSVTDTLRIVVSWDLTLSTPEGQPDSVRVKILPGA